MCSSWPRLRSSRCINSRGNNRPSELPIFLISIFMINSPGTAMPKGMLYRCITCPLEAFNVCNTNYLAHPPQLVDHACRPQNFGFLASGPNGFSSSEIIMPGAASAAFRRLRAYFPKCLIEHEVETPGEQSRIFGRAQQQLAAKQAVGTILWLAGEIELGGEQAAAARLHLHMDVARTADIGARHDAAQSIAPLCVGELMAAQAETGIVVL